MEKEMLKLKVQMLGGFSMTLGDEPLSFPETVLQRQ